jgi:hypothetical protein
MAKRHKRRKQADLDKVLGGAAGADAHQIIDLIRQVNPTGADLSPTAAAERYRQKSALQSRLILGYRERMTVVPDPHREGLVTLYYEGRDACHAVLSELDHEARAWAQRYLDESVLPTPRARAAERPPAPAPSPEPEPDLLADDRRSAAELTAAAAKALERYDYPAAGALLRTALERPGADAQTATAYLTLLVDTLGDAQGALAARLPKAARADAEVRGLLGEAAARLGDPARAPGPPTERCAPLPSPRATPSMHRPSWRRPGSGTTRPTRSGRPWPSRPTACVARRGSPPNGR